MAKLCKKTKKKFGSWKGGNTFAEKVVMRSWRVIVSSAWLRACLWKALNMSSWTERKITTHPIKCNPDRLLCTFSTCQDVRCHGDYSLCFWFETSSNRDIIRCLYHHLPTTCIHFSHLTETFLMDLFFFFFCKFSKDLPDIEMETGLLMNKLCYGCSQVVDNIRVIIGK